MTTYRPSCRLVFACVLSACLTDTAAAYYSPTLGRFLSRDPLTYVDGPALYRAYFVPSGTDPTGEGKIGIGTCQSYVNSLVKSDPVIKGQIDALSKLSNCPPPTFKCVDCEQGKSGGFNPGTNVVEICTSWQGDIEVADYIQNTIVHELIHKSDHCQSPLPDPKETDPEKKMTCEQLLCVELRAYSCSNDCNREADRSDCLKKKLLRVVYNNTGKHCPIFPEKINDIVDKALAAPGCSCPKPCGDVPPTPPKPPGDYIF